MICTLFMTAVLAAPATETDLGHAIAAVRNVGPNGQGAVAAAAA